MSDYYEIDFLDVETRKSGDAICIRYEISGRVYIHVVDGGFIETGDKVISHIGTYYGRPNYIDNVVVTHPDGDHAAGIRKVLEHFNVGAVWMLMPWDYAHDLLPVFPTYGSAERLASKLRTAYPHLNAIEEICKARGIPIKAPFQGKMIGAFTVLAPTRSRYLELIAASERTPESAGAVSKSAAEILFEKVAAVVAYVRAAWGEEVFSPEETSAENDMSVVQFANITGHKIMLTGDAGRSALHEAADYAATIGLGLPGLTRFQIPHHGSRRNVSSAVLDRILGPRLPFQPPDGAGTFAAIVSSAKADPDHPRKSVIRACIHRGANVLTTEGQSISVFNNAPQRGWHPLTPVPYPSEQEAD